MTAASSAPDDETTKLRPAIPARPFRARPNLTARKLRNTACDVVVALVCLFVIGCFVYEMHASWLHDSLAVASGKSLVGLAVIGLITYLLGRPYLAARSYRRREIRQLEELFARSPG